MKREVRIDCSTSWSLEAWALFRDEPRGAATLSRSRLLVKRAAILLALAACTTGGGADLAANERQVSRADFGNDWPLTVESGVLACEGAGAVTFTTGGTTYAVNGLAQRTYPEIDAIWADAPGPPPKKNIGPLIDRGLALCE